MVELALTLPVLLLIVFAIIEYSVMLGAVLVLSNTANEAARQTTVYRSGFSVADYEAFARDKAVSLLPTYVGNFKSKIQVNVSSSACGDSTCLRLRLAYPSYKTDPLIANYMILPLPNSLTAEATTRVEPNGG